MRSRTPARPPSSPAASRSPAARSRSDRRTSGQRAPELPSLASEDQRQAVLPGSDHHHLRVRALREVLGGFDALPAQQLLADAGGDDALEVRDADGLDALALGLLALAVQR